MDALEAQDVVAGPVLDIAGIFADPHYRARENVGRCPTAISGRFGCRASCRFSQQPHRRSLCRWPAGPGQRRGLPRDPRALRDGDRGAASARRRSTMPEPVVVSYGSSTYEKRDPHELLWHLWQAARACLDRAGIEKGELDGLTLASFSYPPGNVVTLGEHFGLSLRWGQQGVRRPRASWRWATLRTRSGPAVPEPSSAWPATCSPWRATTRCSSFTPAMRDYLAPQGFGARTACSRSCSAGTAICTARSGAAREARSHATRARAQPERPFQGAADAPAVPGGPADRRAAPPVRLCHAVLRREAVLVVEEEPAADRTGRDWRSPRCGSSTTRIQVCRSLPAGFEVYADELFEAAGVSRSDIDLVEPLRRLHDHGRRAARGVWLLPRRGGRFLEETDVSIRGQLPVNTGGGSSPVASRRRRRDDRRRGGGSATPARGRRPAGGGCSDRTCVRVRPRQLRQGPLYRGGDSAPAWLSRPHSPRCSRMRLRSPTGTRRRAAGAALPGLRDGARVPADRVPGLLRRARVDRGVGVWPGVHLRRRPPPPPRAFRVGAAYRAGRDRARGGCACISAIVGADRLETTIGSRVVLASDGGFSPLPQFRLDKRP